MSYFSPNKKRVFTSELISPNYNYCWECYLYPLSLVSLKANSLELLWEMTPVKDSFEIVEFVPFLGWNEAGNRCAFSYQAKSNNPSNEWGKDFWRVVFLKIYDDSVEEKRFDFENDPKVRFVNFIDEDRGVIYGKNSQGQVRCAYYANWETNFIKEMPPDTFNEVSLIKEKSNLEIPWGDMNQDGVITPVDAQCLFRKFLGMGCK